MLVHDKDIDVKSYLNFMAEYLKQEFNNEIRLSVYNPKTNDLIFNLGPIIPNINTDSIPDRGITHYLDPNYNEHFYALKSSKDGEIRIITALPYKVSYIDVFQGDGDIALIFIGIAIAMTFVAYLGTSYVGYMIKRLRELAKHAAANEEITNWEQFPQDELGEIATNLYNIFNRSVHAQNKLEIEQRLTLKAIKEREEVKRTLTNNINHELKTPIGIVKGYIDTIVQNPDMPEKQRTEFLQKSQQNVDRLCTLLNDISTITRLEEAHESIPMTSINLHEFVLTTVAELEESGIMNGMKFTFDIPLDCMVKGNNRLLGSIITNLAKNAASYSQGTEMGISLVSENENFYTFVFYDNGVGVDEKYMPQLFDRFFRIDSGRTRKSGGTGLGLPIVRNSIITMGGSVNVGNRPEGGLQFTFTLHRHN